MVSGRDVVEAAGERHAVLLVVGRALAQRVADAQAAAAEDLAAEAARVDHRADVGDRGVLDEPHGAGLDVDFHFGEADHVGVGLAVVRIGVLGHAHQADAGQRRRRRLGHRVDVAGQLVAVVGAAERDGAGRRLRQRQAARPARRGGRRARRRPRSPRAGRRDRAAAISRSLRIASCAAAWLARVIAWMVWLPSDVQVHGTCLLVSPQTTSTFSHGTSRISAGTRATSMTEWVPRLPAPDCTTSRPSGRMRQQAVVVDRVAADERAHRHADAAHRRAAPLPAALLALGPVEELGALVERLAHERAGDVAALALLAGRAERRLARRRVDLVQLDRDRSPSWRAALASTGSRMAFCCIPPGERCDVRGGLLVSTDRPRKRIASGW